MSQKPKFDLNWKDPKISGSILAVLVLAFVIFGRQKVDTTTTPDISIDPVPAASQQNSKTQVNSTGPAQSNSTDNTTTNQPEAPTQLFCPTQTCENHEAPPVFVLTPEDRSRPRKGQIFQIRRRNSFPCLKIGDRIQLARYDRTLQTAFWIGSAQLISAFPSAAQEIQYNLIPDQVSLTENKLLAPICQFPCRVIRGLEEIQEQNPFLIRIGAATILPFPDKAEQNLDKLKPEQLRALQSVRLPEDKTRPIVLALSEPLLEWRGALQWLNQLSKDGRSVMWLYPDQLREYLIPPSIIGVTEVDVTWLSELEKQRAVALAPGKNMESWPWSATKYQSLPETMFNGAPPPSLSESSFASLWETNRQTLKPIRTINRKLPLVILSQSVVDRDSYYLARLIAAARGYNVFWYRSSSIQWNRGMISDPLPAGYLGPQ